MLKKLIFIVLTLILSFFWISFGAPSFNNEMIWTWDIWYAKSFDWKVTSEKSLADNIYALFFPSTNWNWWAIFTKIKFIAVWLAFLFLIRAGAMFLLYADDENELKKAKMNIIYMFYGAFLIFWAAWLLGKVLRVWADTNATNAVLSTQNNIIWWILLFFKWLAFYVAILMMIYYWYKIVQAQEKEDKIKQARTWLLNIILALVAIKVLDYVYYISQQKNFLQTWSSFLSWFGKILWWVLWVLIVIALLYSAALLITSRGNEEAWKKSKTIIRNVFLVIFIVFLFIVIVFDMIKNFS